MKDLDKIGALVYLPNQKKIERYNSESMEVFDEIDAYWMQREGLIFYPFDRKKQAFFFGTEPVENAVSEFDICPNDLLIKEEYTTSVFLAKEEMKETSLKKVVLARNELLEGSFDAKEAFQKAVKKYPNSYGYYIDLGPVQWVGASPELLLHFEDEKIYTTALAGTKSLDEEFTDKEKEEQEMVAVFIEEKLRSIGLENFERGDLTEAEFGKIKHLKTDFTVKATKLQALELLKHLQPTSAVCGLPRDKSFWFIQEYETLNRNFYAGITGVLKKNSATFFVNLRCLRFFEDRVELFAGAGITQESDPESEWQETERKIATIKELL